MSGGNDVEQLENLYRALCQRSVEKDAEGLRELLDKSYVLIHMNGMRQSGEEYIAAVLDDTLDYHSTEHDSIEVSVVGNRARICGKSWVDATVFGGGRSTWRLEQDLKAVKSEGVWKFTESVASTW